VPEQVPVAADRTALLDRYVTELILLAKAQCPEAVVEVLTASHTPPRKRVLSRLHQGKS